LKDFINIEKIFISKISRCLW